MHECLIEVESFECLGIDFMGPFSSSNSNVYILVCVDYITNWVKAITYVANDPQTISNFFKMDVFARFGIPRVLIKDRVHFCNTLCWPNTM